MSFLRRYLVSVLIVATALVSVGCLRAFKVRNPEVAVQASSTKQVEDAILKSLQDRKWVLVRRNPGTITAKYVRGKHSATTKIDYTKSTVKITLVESENLLESHESGEHKIHRNYNTWVSNLENDILRHLSYK